MIRQGALASLFVSLSLLLAACGSRNNGSPTLTVPTTVPNSVTQVSPISVTVSPQVARVLVGGTQQFAASVTNTTNTNVTWQVNGITGGNELLGTISNTGVYTAPAVIPAVSDLLITAVSSADSTKGAISRVYIGAVAGNHYIYVSSAVDDSIQLFVADNQTGLLEPKSTLLVGSGKSPTSLAVSPTGKFVYSLNRGSNDISIFAIDAATGELMNAGTVAAPDGPYDMVFSIRGDYAYVSCDNASTIATYALNLSTAALTPLSAASYVAGGGRIQGLAISPDGKFLYATKPDSNQIIGLAIHQGDGTLSAINGSPFSAGPGLSSIIATDANAYTGNRDGVGIYARDPSSGVIGLLGTTATGGKSAVVFRNLSSGFLLGVNAQNGGFFSFEVGGDHLDPDHPPVSTGAQPAPGGLLYNPNYYPSAYVLNRNAETPSTTGSIGIYLVTYDGADGPLTTIPTVLHAPTGFAITP